MCARASSSGHMHPLTYYVRPVINRVENYGVRESQRQVILLVRAAGDCQEDWGGPCKS